MNEKIKYHDLLLEVKSLREELHSLTQTKNDLLIHKQQLDAILDNAPVEVILKDREGRYIRSNKQVEKLFGIKNENAIAMFPAELHAPDLAAAARDHDLSVLNSGKAEWREEVDESQSHTWSTIKFPIFNDDGEVDGLGAIITDISESVVAKENLRQSNILFSQAESMGNTGHWCWDLVEDKLIMCSDRFARLYDMTVTEALDHFISTEVLMGSIHPDDKKLLEQGKSGTNRLFEGFDVEYRVITSSGDTRYIYAKNEVVLDNDGAALRSFGTSQDITTEKEIEFSLVQANEAARDVNRELAFQKHALDEHAIVSITDVAGDITYVNDKFCTISGYDREELLAQNHRIVKFDEFAKGFYLDLWETIVKGDTWSGDIKNGIKGGGYYWVNATIVPTLNDNGEPVQYVAISNDITAEKAKEFALIQATEEAQEANLAKSKFLAAMSHEIRTPMAGVIGMSDLLLDTDLSPQQLDWATSIKSSGQNLMSILNEILDQSKLEAGKLEISPTDFHLASFVRDNTHLFGPNIASGRVLTLDIKLDDDLPESIHADSMRIGQVLSNFLSNAMKFTSTGRIEVAVKPEPNEQDELMLRFTVTDSGIGLTDEEKNRLFVAFTQADSSTSRNYGGTGLGLSISKQLVELMGGQIGVESTKGIGSTFWFTVSCQPAKKTVVAKDKRVALDRWVASRPLKILVAEDTIVNQHIIRAILTKLGHSVEIAEDGKCAIEGLNPSLGSSDNNSFKNSQLKINCPCVGTTDLYFL